MILRRTALASLIALTLSGAVKASGSELRGTIALDSSWKVQPAISPDTPPSPSDWGTTASGSWKDLQALKKQDTTWKTQDTTKVNSVWFEKALPIPGEWAGREIIADFRRIEGDAIVFVNDKRVTELLRPGGEVRLTDFVTCGGTNVLRVFSTRDYTGISRKYEQDPLRYYVRTFKKIPMNQWGLGITAPVTLIGRPTTAIADVFVVPSWRKKELSLRIEIAANRAEKDLELHATVFDASHKAVLVLKSGALTVPSGSSVQTISAPWNAPITWELERPYLYTVEAELKSGNKTTDEYPALTFGFREIWTEGKALMMNGHPSRWRLSEIYGANQYGISMYQLVGYNVGQLQPHPDMWWCGTWTSETPIIDESLLAAMDRSGMGCTMPAPSVAYLRTNLEKGTAAADYQREVNYFVKKYRNHPSILAWVVGMNSYCPTENMTPQLMGIRELNPKWAQGKIINKAVEMVHQCDPTRLAFSHADGSTGDISSANQYLNFAQLQEREEWPMSWAANGNMPYSAVEFGSPYSANYWKGKQFLLTEYLAMYLGDRAYLGENDAGLKKTIEYSLSNQGVHGEWSKVDRSEYPCFFDFQRLFTKNTNRAWRAWGVNAGWNYWIIHERYGHPTRKSNVTQYENLNYNFLTEPLTEKPQWASPNFDIYSEANKTLLVYLAGWPLHTDKTHSFTAGEAFKKQIAAVWDGAAPCSLVADWVVKQGGTVVSSGREKLQLAAGEICLTPISVTAPGNIRQRTDCTLELVVTQDGKTVQTDTFRFEVFPQVNPIATSARIAVFDPQGKSIKGLQALGLKAAEWKTGDLLKEIDLLVIGREAIQPGQKLPYQPSDIANGLRVLMLEQTPQVWQSLGFETIETSPRYVFIRDQANRVFDGLLPADFLNWRGSPDLLPEGKHVVAYEAPHVTKWTNRHAVASVALKTPHVIGFTPLLETEFDLAYSPLLEWRCGKGAVWFSTLDFTGRLGVDPVASLFAKNLVEAIAGVSIAPTKPVYFIGGAANESMCRTIGVGTIKGLPANAPQNSILIVESSMSAPSADAIGAFKRNGATVLFLNQTEQDLKAQGIKSACKTIQRVKAPEPDALTRSIGPNLLRWRDSLEIAAFTPDGQTPDTRVLCDGVLMERKAGNGRDIYFQIDPAALANRYLDNADKREAVQLSVLRLHRLVAQLLTNLGAGSNEEIAQRLATSLKAPSVNALGAWQVVGPFKSDKAKGDILDEAFPAQYDALHGAENPNATYKRPDGVVLDWRKTADATEDGHVDLGTVLGIAGKGNVAYVTRKITSDRDQIAKLYLGADYWVQVWVNGTSAIKVDEAHGMPSANAFTVDVPLKFGKNVITMKVGSGTNGFGFWCRLKTGGEPETENGQTEGVKTSLYIAPFKKFDPYHYTYW